MHYSYRLNVAKSSGKIPTVIAFKLQSVKCKEDVCNKLNQYKKCINHPLAANATNTTVYV